MPDSQPDLIDHPFIKTVTKAAFEISRAVGSDNYWRARRNFARELTEYEYFVIENGRALSELWSSWIQMTHIPFYLSSFSPTPSMKLAGITRHHQIAYTMENYIVRTQYLYDRTLKVVNAVFHLGLSPRDCRHEVLVQNVHLRSTEFPTTLQNFRKLVGKIGAERNAITHHESYKEDDLRFIEMVEILVSHDDSTEFPDPEYVSSLSELGKERTRVFVKRKFDEYTSFNTQILEQLVSVMTELHRYYEAKAHELLAKNVSYK